MEDLLTKKQGIPLKTWKTRIRHLKQYATHALRHLGAHYWLSKTNYNYGIIAEVGGWHTIDELKKSYGQIPPEKILEIIK